MDYVKRRLFCRWFWGRSSFWCLPKKKFKKKSSCAIPMCQCNRTTNWLCRNCVKHSCEIDVCKPV